MKKDDFKEMKLGGFYAVLYEDLENPDIEISLLKELSAWKKKIVVVLLDLDCDEVLEKLKRNSISAENFIFIAYKTNKTKCYVLENRGSLVEISQKMREAENKFNVEGSVIISAEKLLLYNSVENIKRFFKYRREHSKQIDLTGVSSFGDNESSSSLIPNIWNYFDKIIKV